MMLYLLKTLKIHFIMKGKRGGDKIESIYIFTHVFIDMATHITDIKKYA